MPTFSLFSTSRSTSVLSRNAATSSSTSDVNMMHKPPRSEQPKHDKIAIMKLVTAAGVDLHTPYIESVFVRTCREEML